MTFKEWWEENQYKEFYRFVSSTTAREIWQAGQNNCKKKMTFDQWWTQSALAKEIQEKLTIYPEYLRDVWLASRENM